MTRIVLHIDRLVLRGIDPADADALAQALRDELGQQLRLSGVRPQGDRYRLDAGLVGIAHDDDADALGRALAARIVERGLS
ncbi:MAG: hypothetical protein JWP80_3157 [Pseudomonas sp.]|nr:hypothetical protein [Pseudomonas sp.]